MIGLDLSPSRFSPPRIVPISGGFNFRDLGGYPTEDGRSVRWGLIFRSGAMNRFSTDDHACLSALGVRTICDLRSTNERQAAPAALPESLNIHYWSRDYCSGEASLIDRLRQGATADDMAQWMRDRYRQLPYEQARSFAELFRYVADGALPLAFNCAAGKDRTGAAAAILLSALGVSREAVIEDYLVSERFAEAFWAQLVLNAELNRYIEEAPDLLQPINSVRRDYLEAMFESIEDRDGSLDVYLDRRLGVDPTMLIKVQTHLLERPDTVGQ